MITVDEAIDLAAGRAVEPPALAPLTDEEKVRFDYIDATIEAGIYKGFSGEMFEFRLPVVYEGGVFGSPALVGELKRRYEEGGWSVAVFPHLVGDDVIEWQFVFAPSSRIAVDTTPPPPKVLPPVATPVPIVAGNGRRLCLRMPTRSRPLQAVAVLELYRMIAGAPVMIEVVIDEDDKTMLNAVILQRLAALGCVVTVGKFETKVEACNGGRLNDWDVLALVSDDMVPVADGYAVRILDAMEKHWPHLDGALFFDDGFQHGKLCTLPIMGRRFYERNNEIIYHPQYRSLYCDIEQTETWRAINRLVYVDETIIEHRHYIWGRAEKDALYERNDAWEENDKATYTHRKSLRFPFDQIPLQLSILICSLPERRAKLEWLLEHLYAQILADYPEQVEILVDDRVGPTVGEKRQALLERAQGAIVAFIDDDDGVAHDYVDRVLSAFRFTPDADCASLVGIVTTDGRSPQRFEHSIKYEAWKTTSDGTQARCPNHLNPVKRELALQVGFPATNHVEDFDYSMRLRPLLKTEASTGNEPLYWYWWWMK